MRLLIAVCFVMAISGLAFAQGNVIDVLSFEAVENAVAQGEKYLLDPNNEKCARIIVQNVDIGGFNFEFTNSFSKVNTNEKDNGKLEYWIYVQEGAKSINISNADPGIGAKKYFFPQPLRGATTYVMKLATIYKSSKATKQYLIFEVNPPTASLEVNGEPWKVENGRAQKLVDFGYYQYAISDDGYYTEKGRVEVNNPREKQTVAVALRPNHGWLNLKLDANMAKDAECFIDGKYIDNAFGRNIQQNSGEHIVKITKPMYKYYEQTVSITDGQTTTIAPKLVPNCSQVTLKVPNNAEIWIDGIKKGEGSWSGPLERGEYIVECREYGHTPTQRQISVTEIEQEYDFSLYAPSPIYGSLSIESTPTDATVEIDGVPRGTTPLYVSDLLIGMHKVVLSKPGYNDFETTGFVEEKITKRINAILDDKASVEINYYPKSAELYIDGIKYGEDGFYFFNQKAGVYDVRVCCGDEYKPYKKKLNLQGSDKLDIRLKEQLVTNSDFYWSTSVISNFENTGVSMALGGHASRFNIEGEFLLDNSDYFGMGLKTGFGFNIANNLKITPQIGILSLFESYEDDANFDSVAYTIGSRIFWASFEVLGLCVTPQYNYTRSQYKSVANGWSMTFSLVVSIPSYMF